jgi:DNA-binding LytR/AlgR family response regulator
VNVVAEAGSASECLALVETYKPDVLFLDIDLKDNISGFDIAESILKIHPGILIVFVTGYSEFGVKAFEINAVDYILKPYNELRVLSAITKLKNLRSENKKHKNKLLIKYGHNLEIVDLNKLVFVEKVSKKTRFYLDDGSILDTNESLSNLQANLPQTFIRAHKSFIINVEKVKKLEPFNPVTYTVHFLGVDQTALMLRSKYDELIKIVGNI